MTLPKLPYWTRYDLDVARLEAELALTRTLEPYHLLVLERDMLPYLARADASRRAGMSMTGARFERRPSPVAHSGGQRVRYEP